MWEIGWNVQWFHNLQLEVGLCTQIISVLSETWARAEFRLGGVAPAEQKKDHSARDGVALIFLLA